MPQSNMFYAMAMVMVFCEGPILREFGLSLGQAIFMTLYTVMYGAILSWHSK